MIASLDFSLVRVGSIEKCLLPLFDSALFAFFTIDELLFFFSDPFSMVDFIFLKLEFKLGFEVLFSDFVSLVVKSLEVFFNFLNVVFVLINLCLKVFPLLFSLILLFLYEFDFMVLSVNVSLKLIKLGSDFFLLSIEFIDLRLQL